MTAAEGFGVTFMREFPFARDFGRCHFRHYRNLNTRRVLEEC